MFTSKLARHIFIPAAALVAEKAKSTSAESVCKPSELPIYSTEVQKIQKSDECINEPPGAIENVFRTARRTIYTFTNELRQLQQVGEDYVQIAFDNAEGLIEYLQEQENTAPKYGAVALGGLTGFIFGLRGGIFRRALYSSIGALGMAAICYPKEATHYSKIGSAEAMRYTTIAYNFVNGVKKDDPPLALPSLPSLPASLSEAWDAAKNIGKSTTPPVTVSDSQCGIKKQHVEEVGGASSEIDINPLCIISEAHDVATSKSCHCPIGACMGHHEESLPVTESEITKEACAANIGEG